MVAAASAAAVAVALVASAPVVLLRRLHQSVGLAAPTVVQLNQERAEACALFRHVPQLRKKLAWRSLGALAPTPVHSVSMQWMGRPVNFYAKREDLIHKSYGGNKVRTLQHQLAVIEAQMAAASDSSDAAELARAENLIVLGTGGSNQVVATAVHAGRLKLPRLGIAWVDADLPDLDNTLNMLSTLSLRTPAQAPAGSRGTWGEPLPMLRELLGGILGGGVVLPLGGNNPTGVLGQAVSEGQLRTGRHMCPGCRRRRCCCSCAAVAHVCSERNPSLGCRCFCSLRTVPLLPTPTSAHSHLCSLPTLPGRRARAGRADRRR